MISGLFSLIFSPPNPSSLRPCILGVGVFYWPLSLGWFFEQSILQGGKSSGGPRIIERTEVRPSKMMPPAIIQRAELLKQECHTGKVASNIHRPGPKNTQKVANALKNNTNRGWCEAPYCFSIHWQLFVSFLGPACVCCYLLFLCDTLASIILPSVPLVW